MNDEEYGWEEGGEFTLKRRGGIEREGMVPSAKHIQGDHDAIDVMRGQIAYVSAYVRAGKLR